MLVGVIAPSAHHGVAKSSFVASVAVHATFSHFPRMLTIRRIHIGRGTLIQSRIGWWKVRSVHANASYKLLKRPLTALHQPQASRRLASSFEPPPASGCTWSISIRT